MFVQIAVLLLQNGADVNARNIYGQVTNLISPNPAAFYLTMIVEDCTPRPSRAMQSFMVTSSTKLDLGLYSCFVYRPGLDVKFKITKLSHRTCATLTYSIKSRPNKKLIT